jgi:putative serine protease PepD
VGRLVASTLAVVALLAIGLVARTAQVASDEATTASARVTEAEGRLDQLAEDLIEQSIELAAAQTALRLLRDDLRTVGESIPEEPDIPGVTRRVLESVFTVKAGDSTGSSFVIASADGTSHLVTNAHVVSRVWNNGGRGVELARGDQRLSAVIEDVSFSQDLALLSVMADLPALPTVGSRADAGSPVLVVGSPLGLEGSVVSGVVSSYRVEEGQEQLQLSAPVNPGNSGGPVTDVSGAVLGVVVAKYVGFEIEGLSFAVPTDILCATFDVCVS